MSAPYAKVPLEAVRPGLSRPTIAMLAREEERFK